MENKFTWPNYPQTNSEFEKLMRAIDKALSDKGLKPFQRPLHVANLLWEAFGWGGLVFPPKELASQPGFEGDIIMAKSYRWYEQTYGKRLNSDFAFGYAPIKLGNAVWRVRFGGIFGSVYLFADRNLMNRGAMPGSRDVDASFNILCAVEELTQGLAKNLSEAELYEYFQFYKFGFENLMWRYDLPSTTLLDIAKKDYDASTQDVLAHGYSQARWGAGQAVEKTIKGLLTIAGTPFPTSGSKGHDLKLLADILVKNHGITILPDTLNPVLCNPDVRYGKELSTEDQAIHANHAVLAVFEQLRKDPKTVAILSLPY